MRERVQVKDLRPGDVLLPTMRKVKHIHPVPTRTSTGLKQLVLLEGEESARSWGRYTKVTVHREDA